VFLFFTKNIFHKNQQNSIVRKIKTKNITISKQPNKKFNKNTTILQSTNHFPKNDSSNNTSILIDKNNYLNIDSRIVSNNNHNNTSSTNTIKNIDYEKITPILSPCLNTQITANFNVKDACKIQSDGEIQIIDIQGGVTPYIITFNNEIIDDATASIYHLNAKNYSIKIQDQNACTNQFEIAVQEKYCIKELMDHSFNPEKGQSWNYQNNYNTNVQVDIIDKLGKTIQTFVLKSSEEIHWNGQTIDGQFADTGSYVCIIKNNEQILEKGFILIYK
jgi:hypothetical protein